MSFDKSKYEIKLKSLPASVFKVCDESPSVSMPARPREINFGDDSYVVAFTGPRGAGKTTAMTRVALYCGLRWKKRIISNYEMMVEVNYRNGDHVLVKSESFDFQKLFDSFVHHNQTDDSFDDCLYVLDEAPLFIGRWTMASWKNRLVNLWVQQIRKTNSSMLYGTQQKHLVDSDLQYQTDIRFECSDLFRLNPESGYQKGGIIHVDMIDLSGQWRGYDEKTRLALGMSYITDQESIAADFLHNTFDSLKRQDINELLAKVKMEQKIMTLGDSEQQENDSYKWKVFDYVKNALRQGNKYILQPVLNKTLELTKGQKDSLRSLFDYAGGKLVRNEKARAFMWDLSDFNENKFIEAIRGIE